MRSHHRLMREWIRFVNTGTLLPSAWRVRSVITDDRYCYEAVQQPERVRPGAASRCV